MPWGWNLVCSATTGQQPQPQTRVIRLQALEPGDMAVYTGHVWGYPGEKGVAPFQDSALVLFLFWNQTRWVDG